MPKARNNSLFTTPALRVHHSLFTIHNSSFSIPSLLLALLILTYAGYFSWYTINRHNTLNSYAADLSLIDQPMWNTVLGPGYFMEQTWGDRQQPRLAEHFEPILVPLALLFFLWDDVRILLIAQSIALALGALPVYWIARHQLSIINYQLSKADQQFTIHNSQFIIHNSQHLHCVPAQVFTIHNWSALVFAAVYLLSPHLQAANIADFHADPFVVTPLLFAFWYASQRRWLWLWFWAIVAMAAKETLPTLTAMLGLWLLGTALYRKLTADRRRPTARFDPAVRGFVLRLSPKGPRSAVVKPELWHGAALALTGMAWFLIATFLIVAPLARQYFGSDGPIYLANRYSGGLAGLPALLQEPARWRYVFGLLASVGFLPLLAPELLLLGLPVLAANLLSNFPGQYSGEQHYSAPLVAALLIAAIYGARRLVDFASIRPRNGQILKVTTLLAVLLWLGSWALGYHALHGWTPLSTRLETYHLRPAAARLPEFTAPIPPAAIVSASAAVHPHLAHRRIIYVFPTIAEAEFFLVDVTDIPGVHPNDAHAKIVDLLNTTWQLRQANQGLILAQKSTTATGTITLPDSFFDFARAAAPPPYPVALSFGDGRLRLLGYDFQADPDDGVALRFYWQSSAQLPGDLRLWPLVYDDLGRLLSDPTQVPMIAAVWYPPSAWRLGETVVTATLPQLLPDTFHLGLAVGPESSFANPDQRWPVTGPAEQTIQLHPGNWVQLASFKQQGPFLTRLPAVPTLQPLTPVEVQFGPAIWLTGYWFQPEPVRPGDALPVLLQWTAGQPPAADYTVFVHLLAPDGRLVAQSDAAPTWLTPAPTSQWPLNEPQLDSHMLNLPGNLPVGIYTLQVGLYDPHTLERLAQPDGSDVFVLGEVEAKK